MSTPTVAPARTPAAVAATLAIGVIVAATASVAVGQSNVLLGVGVLLLAAVPVVLSPTLPWRVLLSGLVLLIVFIPIRRYTFSTDLPIQLEPYRVAAAVLLAGWLASLLIDDRTRLRRTGLEGPMLLVGAAALTSIILNPARAAAVQPEVIKTFSYFVSFVLLFFLITTVTRTGRDTDALLKTLVIGMAVVGALAIVERRSGWSPFTQFEQFFPLLTATGDDQLFRGSGVRARASAEHPIALGAALVLVVPIALYLARTAKTRRFLWWGACAILAIGALATLSRTGLFMLAVVGLVFLWLRPRETVRFWPLLVPFLAVIHFALPGTLGSIKASFLPEGGLIASQNAAADEYDCSSSGRIADIGPALDQLSASPFLGIGFGTRIVVGDENSDPPRNACILDDQWLGTLLETGIVGALAWLWLFVRLIRQLALRARARGPSAELCVVLAASVAAFATGMFTFDAFGFVQVTFLLFLLMALSACVLRQDEAPDGVAGVSRRPA